MGIEGMEVSDRREIVIPPDLAKGPQGEGEIPANATLVYVVDLLGEPKSAEEQQ
jgi:FKBP-type peptidyl-prolyl cis-trans isomerase